MIAIADHRVGVRPDPRKRRKSDNRRPPDEEVASITQWLRQHTQRIEKGERVITYRQLRSLLAQFGFGIANAGQNQAEIVRDEVRETGIIFRRQETVQVRVGYIGYRDEGTDIPKSELKRIRQMCNLTEADGVDSTAFYSTGIVVDAVLNRYRKVLQRLARN